MTSVLQLQYQEKNVVIKKNYIISDEFHMEKYRALQISTFLCLPDHLAMAQQLFGYAVGLGSRKIIKCSLKRRAVTARQIARQQINYTDSLNVIPFQVEVQHNEEYQRRGILIKYIPSESELSITAKYRKLSGRMQLEPHLLMRKIARRNEPEMGDDSYPLFADTDVFGSTIAEINLGMEMVTFFVFIHPLKESLCLSSSPQHETEDPTGNGKNFRTIDRMFTTSFLCSMMPKSH